MKSWSSNKTKVWTVLWDYTLKTHLWYHFRPIWHFLNNGTIYKLKLLVYLRILGLIKTLINGGCKIETTIEWNLMNISKCSQRQSNFSLKNCFKVPMPKILLIFAKGEISKVLWKSSSWLLIRNICYRRNFFRDLFFKDFV